MLHKPKKRGGAFLLLLLILTAICTFVSCSAEREASDENIRNTLSSDHETDEKLDSVIISQVYGTGKNSDAAVRHSYIQLYNTADSTVSLGGASLYVRAGESGEFTEYPFGENEVIRGKHCYLIRGAEAEEKDSTPYSDEYAVLRIDEYDRSINDMLLDNSDNTVFVAASGMTLTKYSSPAKLDGVSAYYIGTEEEDESNLYNHSAGDMSKNKVAVKTGNLTNSHYTVYNLTKCGTADLIRLRPETSAGDVNTYTASRLNEVVFSDYAGLYREEISLTLSAPEGYTIYYTTDGSEPTTESAVYSEPIELTDTTQMKWGAQIQRGIKYFHEGATPTSKKLPGAHVIKAMATDGENRTDVYTNSYFIFSDYDGNYEATVFSISMPERAWISAEGFYNNFGRSDPRPRSEGYVEVFTSDGERVGHSIAQLAVSGKYSASKFMKSLRIYYKSSLNTDKESENNLKYTLFGDYATDSEGGVISEFDRLILRNGGNDCGFTYIRDGFSQRLGGLLGVDHMAFTPALVFINGEFWGVYNCRERYETLYITAHYGVAKKNVTVMESDYSVVNQNNLADYVVSDGNEADGREFNKLYHYIDRADLSVPEQYEYVCSKLDTDSVIDMYVEHLILGAADWPHNNIKLWRNNNPNDPSGMDTKWHYALLDQDTTLGLSRGPNSDGGFAEAFNKASVTALITTKLMANDDFRARFFIRYYEAATEIYTVERMTEMFWEVYDEYKPLMELQAMRWPGDFAGMETWEKQMNVVLSFIQNRPKYALEHLYNYFDIDEEYILCLIEERSALTDTDNNTEKEAGENETEE